MDEKVVKKEWYIVHVLTGFEEKVKHIIEEKIKQSRLEDKFGEITIPRRKVSKLAKNGKSVIMEKRLYPGYILVKMEESDETMNLIASTPHIVGFLGSKSAHSISEEEVQKILNIMGKKVDIEKELPYQKGDVIRIIDGPFTDFSGVVKEIYPDRQRIKVMVTIFGRSTPVELSVYQVQAI